MIKCNNTSENLFFNQVNEESRGEIKMKKVVIGGFILLSGLLTTLTIIFAAAIYASSITMWVGKSKLWYAIFGANHYGNEVSQSLHLGFPFIIGVLLSVIGLTILGQEYFNIPKNLKADNLPQKQKTNNFTEEIKESLNNFKITQEISEAEVSFIKKEYLTDGKINDVYPTPFKNYYLLDVDGELHLVVIKNNLALKVTEPHLNKKIELKDWYEQITNSKRQF